MERLSEEEMVAAMRKNYPDLTDDEEHAIRNHVRSGAPLLLRCKFDNNTACGIRIGDASDITVDADYTK